MIIIIKILINYKIFYFNKGIYVSSEKKGTVMPILSLFFWNKVSDTYP